MINYLLFSFAPLSTFLGDFAQGMNNSLLFTVPMRRTLGGRGEKKRPLASSTTTSSNVEREGVIFGVHYFYCITKKKLTSSTLVQSLILSHIDLQHRSELINIPDIPGVLPIVIRVNIVTSSVYT